MTMTIPEWYTGRSVFITGGTGFMGKVLIEKLLRSCPGVERIYVLIRQKRGLTAARRIQQMINLPLFDRIRAETPNIFTKIVGIDGDLTLADLGLSDYDRQRITKEVSIVFHGAASLRLEAGLKDAIEYNTRPTERVIQLAKEMTLLKAFVHLSTAFCHCEEEVLEEKTYPPEHNPQDVISVTKFLDEASIELITPRILGVHPNSYTYSKRLTETLVEQHAADIPATIVRPSIVLPTLIDPMPGWVDTLNGPIGVLVAAGKGVLRTMMCGAEFNAEVIPVDIAINAIICVAWTIGTQKTKGASIPVYNISQSSLVQITWGEVLEKGKKAVYENPFEGAAWYPDGAIRTNRLIHNLLVILLHIIPAYLIDFIMLLTRQKRFMVRVQGRISTGLEVLQYFTMRQWRFNNGRLLEVSALMCEEDKRIFYMANAEYDVDKYILDCILGARVYCMKEPLTSLPSARRHMTALYYLDRFVAYALYALLVWFLYKSCTWVNSIIV